MIRSAGFVCVMVVGIAGGCASTSPKESFQRVHDRSGHHVIWRTGSQEDAEADAAVRGLLSQELTADAAVQVALLNNRNLQATFEQLGIAQAQLVRAGVLRNPVFHAEVKFIESGGGEIIELAVVQTISELLTMPLRKRLAESEAQEAELNVSQSILQLAGDVRRAVVELQYAQQMQELRQTTLAAAEASAAYAQALRDAGNITALDLANERAMHEQARLELAETEALVAAARERLSALMGVWGDDTGWQITARLPDPSDDPDLDSLESEAVERSLALAVAKQQLTRAGESLRSARPDALLDGVEVGIAAEREDDGEWSVGPSIGIPIPIFDQGQSAGAIASADYNASLHRYAALAVELRSSARAAAVQLRAARQRAVYLRSVMLPLRQQILSETEKQYNAMQVGAFQLLRAKQDQVDAAAHYVRALRDYWTARVVVDSMRAGGASGAPLDAPARATPNRPVQRGGH